MICPWTGQLVQRKTATGNHKGRGEEPGTSCYLSLTLEAEYMEYRGQGKRATPEEMFRTSPFLLKGKEAKFSGALLPEGAVRRKKTKGLV